MKLAILNSAMPARDTEVFCLGESMALVAPVEAEPLEFTESFTLGVGGAESTVALYLAEQGHAAEWVSQVGADPLGRRMLRTLNQHDVGTSHVVVVEDAPTGVYFKDPQPDGTKVHYYRTGSAASRMTADVVNSLPLEDARLMHISGITAALSASCRELLTAVFDRSATAGALVSFDVNYRPGLWPVDEAAPALLDLARRADVVFVGRDEAEVLWDTTDAASVAEYIAGSGVVVIKDNDVGATEIAGVASFFEPAETVDVVEPVGAGDAFAAGYLSALLRGRPSRERLLNGHRLAARALGSVSDFVPAEGK
ncbi:sugar kinase [Arthrobacter monumenti]